MSTSTILRVKRRLEDNPQDAFVITCKRPKTDTEELSPSLFIFRGTIKIQETIPVKNLVPKETHKSKVETNLNDIIQKIRKERKDVTNKHRYEIVKFSRGLNDNEDEINDKKYHLVDLAMKENDENNSNYIYDLYTTPKPDFDISMLDDLVSIENYETDLVLDSYKDNEKSKSTSGESSDDSNDENNWRNDYPEEENSSIDEDDMIRAMERCDLDDLSSDTGEDKIYNEEDSLNHDDVLRYGEAYAKYKAKVLNEPSDLSDSRNFVHCVPMEPDKQSLDGYKVDSDDGFYYGQEENTDQFRDQYKDNQSSDESDAMM